VSIQDALFIVVDKDAIELAAGHPLEVLRTIDGRVLLHWSPRSGPQVWLELAAQERAWLREELAQ